ncbi:MAG: SSS family solute:Na+ symporter [Verrucomicrobiales bacterium]|jgi:SSS family solute:Na+ symporter
MGTIYIIVLAVYLVLLLVLGTIGYLKSKGNEEDFYLAGRGQGLIVTVFTIMATMFSSAAILGIPGNVYTHGAAFLLFALNLPVAGAAIYIFGSRFMRIGRKRGYVTPGDMIAGYYGGSPVLRVLVALTAALYVLPYVIMQIKAGGILAQQMFPSEEVVEAGKVTAAYGWGMFALSVVTVFYVLVGGMRSVAWTDVLQGALLLFGMVVAGIAMIIAMGGVGGYFERLREIPPEALRIPGPVGKWTWSVLLTVIMYASVSSIIQPSQWMRLYAAKDAKTLKRSAMIFATVLPICFLFGSMLVAMGGRVEQPPTMVGGELQAAAAVGKADQIVPFMIGTQLPEVFGGIGVLLVAIIFVAILAASMSTADSNLHGFSAVFMRDIYERFFRPNASEKEKAWGGRLAIIGMMGLAAFVAYQMETTKGIGDTIAGLMFTAIAFSCQLLPVVIDMLFVRKGTSHGATAGIGAGILVVFCFTPLNQFFPLLKTQTDTIKTVVDIGFAGFTINVLVFMIVSALTKPLPSEHVESMKRDMEEE